MAGPSLGSGVFPAAPCGHHSLASALHLSLGTKGTWHLQPHSLSVSPFPQTREKEKMKEAKDARYTNGHLFTTISVSGMTMCYACNKSITAKEALICPSKSCGSRMSLCLSAR